jgi:hypothetical protein
VSLNERGEPAIAISSLKFPAKTPSWRLGCRGAISAVLVRIVYRFVAPQMKIFPHYREQRDGCMIAIVLEVKGEIPV